MQKRKHYYSTRFPASVLKEAYDMFLSHLDPRKDARSPQDLVVKIEDESWNFNFLNEFLAEYPKSNSFRFEHSAQGNRIIVEADSHDRSSVLVRFETREKIESIFQIFERNLESSKVVAETDPIKIFIGHGRDPCWRDLKDHLQDQHGFEVIAYEIGPRAGRSVKEVLETMLNKSSFALLVLTGEDQHVDGEIHARENVIHELGLFQGKLGFTKTIALLEEGVKEFSNILGINQIRFSKGNIRETFGDILATIKREFEGK